MLTISLNIYLRDAPPHHIVLCGYNISNITFTLVVAYILYASYWFLNFVNNLPFLRSLRDNVLLYYSFTYKN